MGKKVIPRKNRERMYGIVQLTGFLKNLLKKYIYVLLLRIKSNVFKKIPLPPQLPINAHCRIYCNTVYRVPETKLENIGGWALAL